MLSLECREAGTGSLGVLWPLAAQAEFWWQMISATLTFGRLFSAFQPRYVFVVPSAMTVGSTVQFGPC